MSKKKDDNRNTIMPIPYGNKEDIIPKYCTNINLATLKSGNIVLSFYFSAYKDKEYLLNTIVIEPSHLKDFKRVIDETILKADNDVTVK